MLRLRWACRTPFAARPEAGPYLAPVSPQSRLRCMPCRTASLLEDGPLHVGEGTAAEAGRALGVGVLVRVRVRVGVRVRDRVKV